MSNRFIFEYAIIRFVPQVEREEFLNVGVILFSKAGNYLGIKYELDATRLRCFGDEINIDQLRAYLRGWESVCEGGEAGGEIGRLDKAGRFRWLTAKRSTIIQSSPVHPGACDDPGRTLEELFARYVSGR